MKKISGFVSLFIFVLSLLLKCMYGNEVISEISILFMIAFLILLIFEVVPVTLSCLFSLAIMPIIGITTDFNSALSGFSNQVVFFILASFGMAMALNEVPLSRRLLKIMIKRFGKNSRYLVLAFMICTALVSSIISNVSTCAVFLSIILNLLELYDDSERKQMGKTMMIAIPIASMIGGVITPAGSSIHLLAINLLEKYTDTSITFVQWMCIGIPVAVLLLPLNWMLLVKKYPPVDLAQAKLDKFLSGMDIPEKVTKEEKKVLVISGIMLCLWILSSWVPYINVMVVAVIGCCAFCFPKHGVLDVNELFKKINWDAFFLVGTVLSMGNILVQNGVTDQVIQYLPTLSGMPVLIVLMYIAVITFLILIVVPVAPSLIIFLSPAIIQIAINAGINPALAITLFSICACNCYLFPLDTVSLLTYSKGYYKMGDMFKVSFPTQVCAVVVVAVIGMITGSLFGWI